METTLYKKNAKGKVLIWTVTIKQSYSKAELEIKTGEYYGKKVLSYKKVEPKNIGKSNETSSIQQAEAMQKSLLLIQRKHGYKSLEDLNISDIDLAMGTEEEFVSMLENNLPDETTDIDDMRKSMLASGYFRSNKGKKVDGEYTGWTDPYGKVWKDRKYFYLQNPNERKEKGAVVATFPCGGQPKINGVRCNVYLEDAEVKMKSKEGEQYYVSHIIDWFTERLEIFTGANGENLVFDGELYIHNELLQYIRSAVTKPNLSTPSVTYEIYDIAVENHSNRARYHMLKDIFDMYVNPSKYSPINLVKMVVLVNDVHVQSKTDEFINLGYEGIIIRDLTADYQFGKRNKSMMKLKRLINAEFQIIGIRPQDNDPELGLYTCMTKDGIEFNVTPTEDEDHKRLMIMAPHVFLNKDLSCAFYEYTDKGIPFHIIHNIVRDYENNTTNKSY
jgi:hypothetical protein